MKIQRGYYLIQRAAVRPPGSPGWAAAAVAVVLGCLASCSPPLERYEFQQPHMGTRVRLALYAPDEAVANAAADAAFARISELNATLSDYESESELSKLSATAGSGQKVAVSDDLWRVLELSQEIARASGGAFDITVGQVVRQWRRARAQKQLPTEENLRRALESVGYQHLRLDPRKQTAELLKPNMRLDPGGIGKGYAADEALKVLESHGIARAMVDAGGNVAAGRAPPGELGWTIALMPMPGGDASSTSGGGAGAGTQRYLLLENAAVSTSGAAFQSVVIDGTRYSHIVDPRTGIGLTAPIAVTVVAADAALADALSTAISVLGAEKGLNLADQYRAAALIFIQQPDGSIQTFESDRAKDLRFIDPRMNHEDTKDTKGSRTIEQG